MSDYPSTIIRNTRRIIANGIPEIQHLTKGDLPASFGLAADFARKIMEACTAAENALVDHVQTLPSHPTGNDAWAAIYAEPVDDLLNELEDLAIQQDSDPAVKLRHLIQCHANPGARWTERCLELVDELVAKISELDALWTESNASYYEMMAERDALRARLASGDIQGVDP